MSFVLALITSLIEAKMKHLTLEYSTRLNQSQHQSCDFTI